VIARTRTLLLATSLGANISTDPEPHLKLASSFCAYRDAIRREVELRPLPMSVFVWKLPTEGVVANDMTSKNMNSLLRQAAKVARIVLPDGLTEHCHRSGSATAAKKLTLTLQSSASLPIGMWYKTLFKAHYRSNLKCTLVLQIRSFADLLE
jgi:hypothetical protein